MHACMHGVLQLSKQSPITYVPLLCPILLLRIRIRPVQHSNGPGPRRPRCLLLLLPPPVAFAPLAGARPLLARLGPLPPLWVYMKRGG